ncbi:MAG TPA: TonB-dependent receptor [Blastocatellia bacterium]|nr:TonB-dependent receptor [Blastocatellia bacterium]
MSSHSFLKSKLAGLALYLLAGPLLLNAQSTSGSMTGTVLDKNGAAIINAKVGLTDQRKQLTLTATTDQEGRFAYTQLQPGEYTVKVEAGGFRRLELKNVVLNANDKLSVGALILEIGTVEQIVEVVSEGQQLKTESGERSDALIGEQLQNIAVNSRSYLSLAAVTPGVVFTGNLQTAGHAGLSEISANGARFNQNQLTLNGIGNVDTGNNGDQLATISLDSVQEYKILTGNYQAEYGRSAGAQINVVTKSGTREFHGSGYLFHRHEGLNANNWKNNRDGLDRNLYRFNDAGYTIGGPVKLPKKIFGPLGLMEDQLFFFWSQEYQRQLRPQGRRDVTVPTGLERMGDFSQSVDKDGNLFNTIKDPLSTLPCTRIDTRGCFADGGVLGRIPQGRLSGPGLAILNLFPLPNAQSSANKGFNFRTQTPDSYPRREDLLRIDANLTANWKVFGHVLNNSDSVTSDYGSFVLGSNTPFGTPITDSRPGRSYAVGVTMVLSPTLTNEFTWGTGHNQINIDPVNDGLTRAANGLSNLPVLFTNAIQNDFIPRFQFNGTRISNEPVFGTNNAPFFNYNSTIDFIDHASKVWRQHVFKAGVYLQRSRKDQTSFANANGQFNFGDSSSNPFDTGFGFANAAVGVFTSFNQASQYATGRYRYTNLEFYLQDTWKATRRLTLDYGMRFYWIQPQFDSSLQTATFLPERFDPSQRVRLYRPALDAGGNRIARDPVTGEMHPAADIGKIVPNSGNLFNGIAQAGKDVNKYLMENRGLQYGPRIGVAFDVTGKQNLVVRGGAGIYYDRFQGNETFDMLTNPPTTLAPTLVNGRIDDINPSNVVFAPFDLNAFSFEGKIPTVYSFSLGVQAKLPADLLLDVAYVGSLSRHLLQRLNLNAVPYGATFMAENQDPTKAAANPNAPLGSNAFDSVFLRPSQGYGNITLHQMGGTSNYNSLQVGLNRRFARGLFFGLSYTWSKALTTVTNDGDFIRIDDQTRLANYGPAGFDRRHNFTVNYIYDLPSLSRRLGRDHAAARMILDGWQISGITRFQSGAPYGVGYSIPNFGNPNITGSYTEPGRVRLIGDPSQGASDNPYQRLNPAAFAAPGVGSLGLGAPVNYLVGPGVNTWDLSFQKTFAFNEKMRLQLRADAFNVFNHTQFSGINSTLNFRSSTDLTPANLPNSDGSVNKDGFGTVSGARDPRIMQLVVRFQF